MFCPHKNSYLQLVCAMNPRVINKAVDLAMQKELLDLRTEIPAAKRLESMQPSLYAPHVDITRSTLGFGRIGLKLLIRDLHSPDYLVQKQAVHSLLDQVQISENASFLISEHVVYRFIDLMLHPDPIIREKICLILTSLTNYYEGRKKIMSRPKIIENLMHMTMNDRKELRYASAVTLHALSTDRCCVEDLLKCKNIVKNLLKMVKYDHTAIVILHLKTLERLIEWDQVCPLKANAFQIMLRLMIFKDKRIASEALNCMIQLCKHEVGRKLADMYDLTYTLLPYITSPHLEIIISALGLMGYTTLTIQSKWRAREFCNKLTDRLVILCHSRHQLIILRSMLVLINLCDSPDIRNHMKTHWLKVVEKIKIRSAEEWDGTSETAHLGCDTGHNYRTVFIDGVETIQNDTGDNPHVINVHSYVKYICEVKGRLIKAINWKAYKN